MADSDDREREPTAEERQRLSRFGPLSPRLRTAVLLVLGAMILVAVVATIRLFFGPLGDQ